MAVRSASYTSSVNHTAVLVSPILVGRDDLLDLADQRIREVQEGSGRFLLLSGEAGVGKTRLLGAIERRAAAAGFQTIRCGAYPSDLQVGAAILIDLARSMGRIEPLEPVASRLAARLEDEGPAAGDPHRRRRLLVLDVAEILATIAADGPAMLSFEDVHWSDDLTLEILEALARRVPEVPLLVAATFRTDELFARGPFREWRARLVAQRRAEQVRVGRLTAADTATMATLLISTGLPIARDIAAAIHGRTDGIPLHVEELLAVLATSNESSPDAVRQAEVPESVEDAIVARFDQRSPGAQAIARAGAVIGRAFDLDLLSAVVDIGEDELSRSLTELADQFILLPTSATDGFGFRHSLICDAIYERISAPDRRRLHARVADAAVGTDVGTDSFLAFHFERAGRGPEAHAAALRGAAAATLISSHGVARELYACALRTAPVDLDPGERGRLLEAFGTSAAANDDNAVADAAFRDARAAYRAAGDSLAAAAVVAPLAAVRHVLGDGLERRAELIIAALAEISHAPSLHAMPSHPPSDRVRGRLLAALASAYMLDRRLDESIAFATEARRLAGLAGDAPTEWNAATTLGSCLVFAGRMDEGWRLLTTSIAESRAAHLEAEAARGSRMLGSCASVLLDYQRAETWLQEGIDYAERAELWNHRHYMAAHLAHVYWATGRWAAAADVARQALADGRGGVTTRIAALHALGFVALGWDDLDGAAEILGEARDLGRRMAELQRLSPALWGLAEVALARGDAAAAIELAESGRETSAAVRDAGYLFPFVVTGTRAYLAAGDPQAARRWLASTADLIQARRIPGTLVAIDHAEGLLALADGSTGQARESLGAAATGWAELGRSWEGTASLVDLARAQLRSNRRVEAARTAATAATAATELGAPRLIAAAAEVLTAARRGNAGGDPWSPLSAREFEVTRLVADGMTNAQIAAELAIAPKTVAAHIEHMLAKLSVSRRAEIAAWTASVPVLHSRPHGGDREE